MGVLDKEYVHESAFLKIAEGFFTIDEMKCSCGCGASLMNLAFLRKLVTIRKELGQSIRLSSAYRCLNHPEEACKVAIPWKAHPQGIAVDISLIGRSREYRARLMALCHKHGIKGIGLANSFMHIDDRDWYALYFYPGFEG